MFDVYCHTSPSGKRYVGWTGGGMAARWREHVQESASGSDRLICRAIRKYGADAFVHELLEQCDTEASAKRAEVRWIASRQTQAPAGYNMTVGGEGVRGLVRSAEFRARSSAARRGISHGPLSAEHKAVLRAAEHRKALSEAWKSRPPGSPETSEKKRAAWTPEMRRAAADRARAQAAARKSAP